MDVDGLKMKLTNEKLYVNSAISNETFALRSINGVGIVSLIEQYNKALEEYKKGKFTPIAVAIGFAFGGLINFAMENVVLGFAFIGVGVLLYFFIMNMMKKEPELMSAVRIMLNGMNRDFEFNKKSAKAPEVAKFVALVEDTLTAYHKNN